MTSRNEVCSLGTGGVEDAADMKKVSLVIYRNKLNSFGDFRIGAHLREATPERRKKVALVS